ncbi:HAD-IIB family hydrolase [Arcanobacterium hippocoleae]|uniref:Cof subfamily protein (Haloacid dehalogenase superfamily) n=1 Tax=Arcanobacterium hippocoleae TaxID=149017 RepID=A0ABU1T1T8_9ACTO|nr:HAD-IIB family hydrolase [Arcanobacterium hippocoleae]MDR6939347.1 Cof subfamily protein (haloacid dehalogenase superfamily) [Arcanobacterium hippocoleae]
MINEPLLLDFAHLPWPAEIPTHCVFDVDGTLANEKSILTAETNAALRNLDAAGIPIIIATGRPLPWSDFLFHDAKVKGWIVASNGAVVWDGFRDQIVDVQLLPASVAQRVIETAHELGVSYFLETADEILVSANDPYIPHVSQISMQTATGLTEFPRIAEDNIQWDELTKVCFAAAPARIDAIEAEVLSRFPSAVRGGPEFLDVTLPHVTKRTGIEYVHQQLGLNAATGLGAGDSGNDVSWLAMMGIPVAAPNATPDLRAEAKYILPATENPVADLINAILSRR